MVSCSSQLNVPISAGGARVDVFSFFSFLYSNPSLNYLVYSRWEEERYTDGVKWKFLEHKGPVFAPPYEPLPSNVKFYYDGKPVSQTYC